MSQKRPTTSPALAFASQRVFHGGGSGSKSKLPPTITKNQHAVPPEFRRKRAVDAFFEQQQKSIEAKSKRELKATGGNGGGGGRWNENPMQRFRLKNGIFDPEDGKSCFYMRASKEVHGVQLPSYKTDCPRNCEHDTLTSSPNEPGAGSVHCATGDTNSFYVEPLTRLMRDRWSAKENMRSQNIVRHESTYGLRRLKDRSAQTLDNQYRQEMDPTKPSQTVMKSVLGGTFYDAPPTKTGTNHTFKRQSSSNRPSSSTGGGRIIGDPRMAASSGGSNSRSALTPNFVNANKRNVRSASAVVGLCRSKGAMM